MLERAAAECAAVAGKLQVWTLNTPGRFIIEIKHGAFSFLIKPVKTPTKKYFQDFKACAKLPVSNKFPSRIFIQKWSLCSKWLINLFARVL